MLPKGHTGWQIRRTVRNFRRLAPLDTSRKTPLPSLGFTALQKNSNRFASVAERTHRWRRIEAFAAAKRASRHTACARRRCVAAQIDAKTADHRHFGTRTAMRFASTIARLRGGTSFRAAPGCATPAVAIAAERSLSWHRGMARRRELTVEAATCQTVARNHRPGDRTPRREGTGVRQAATVAEP